MTQTVEEKLLEKFKQKFPDKKLTIERKVNPENFHMWNYVRVDGIGLRTGWSSESVQDLSVIAGLDGAEEISYGVMHGIEYELANDTRFKK